MRRTFPFTDAGLRKLPLPPKPQQVDYFDKDGRGFGIRVSYGGRKTFFLMYSDCGKRQRVGLGEFGLLEDGRLPLAVARKRARVRLGEIAANRRPAAEAREARRAPTVNDLARAFIEAQRARGIKSTDKQGRMLAQHVLPAIGAMRAREVKRSDIKRVLKAIVGPTQANRVHEVVRAMFGWGMREEIVETNPAERMDRNPESKRERWLSLEELAAYWRALPDTPAGDALKLCLLTAQRQANVLGMRRDQIAWTDRMWIIPAATTKTRRPYRAPLSRMAMEIIGSRIEAKPRSEGEGGFGSVTLLQKTHREACRQAGIANYRPHDHRHTFATHCEQMGVSRLVWDVLLGHGSRTMADLYSGHDFADQRRECMERWADRIACALSDDVISFERRGT